MFNLECVLDFALDICLKYKIFMQDSHHEVSFIIVVVVVVVIVITLMLIITIIIFSLKYF